MANPRRAAQITIFFCEIIIPLLLFIFVGQLLLNHPKVIAYLDTLRQPMWMTDTNQHIESQALHIKAMNAHPQSIILLGSSSVVNGIDVAQLRQLLGDKVISNYGMSNFLAYELFLMQNELLSNSTKTLIYFYNGFSFPEKFHPQGAKYRWGFTPGIKLAQWHPSLEAFQHVAAGTITTLIPQIQYRHALKSYLMNNWIGILIEYDTPYDYQANGNIHLTGHSIFQPQAWFQSAYQASAQQTDNMSFRSLQAFLELAQQKGKKVVIVPIPEPKIIFEAPWAKGLQKEQLDKKIQDMAKQHQAMFIHRESFASIENNPQYFQDFVHLNPKGRQVFTDKLYQALKRKGVE